ncbi:hypothetical protein ATCC90586_010969 [Pythium insidiosum]|nr:hypothetical protein ATCC90586_010969 [Pythium insidiosum]
MIAKTEELIPALVNANAVAALVGLVHRSVVDWVLEQVLGVLAQIVEGAASGGYFQVAELIPYDELTAIVVTAADDGVRQLALCLLAQLASAFNAAQPIVQADGVAAVACVIAANVPPEQHAVAMFLLGWLAKCPESMDEIREHNLVELVVQYMRVFPSGERENAALFLWTATGGDEDLRPMVTAAGGVELLVDMMQSQTASEVEAAAGALAQVLDVDDDGTERASWSRP